MLDNLLSAQFLDSIADVRGDLSLGRSARASAARDPLADSRARATRATGRIRRCSAFRPGARCRRREPSTSGEELTDPALELRGCAAGLAAVADLAGKNTSAAAGSGRRADRGGENALQEPVDGYGDAVGFERAP